MDWMNDLSIVTSFLCRINKPNPIEVGSEKMLRNDVKGWLRGCLPPLPRYPGDPLWGRRHRAKRSSVVDHSPMFTYSLLTPSI
jgi:hypothetical protein